MLSDSVYINIQNSKFIEKQVAGCQELGEGRRHDGLMGLRFPFGGMKTGLDSDDRCAAL